MDKINLQIEKVMRQSGNHCEESIHAIHNADSLEKLVVVLFDYIKPCLKKKFPTYEIMTNFRKTGELYGLYVDSTGEFNALPKNILYGKANITLEVKDYDIITIYLCQDSKVHIKGGNYAIVHIYQLDNSSYSVENNTTKIKAFHELN